jgi:hemoglobin
MTKSDIETRSDIDRLLREFYNIAIPDTEIGHHFVDMDLETHLPVIGDFWEKILFARPIYFGNPLIVHEMLQKRSPLEREHFARWVEIFRGTVDRYFAGSTAEKAKQLAGAIANNLHQRLNGGTAITRGA